MILIKEVQFIVLNDNEYVMLNLINGAADIIDKKIYAGLLSGEFNFDDDIIETLVKRRYIFNNEIEYRLFLDEMDSHLNRLEQKSIPNFVLVPSYACNLCCTYCYEQTYPIDHPKYKDNILLIDKQFDFIKKILQDVDTIQDTKDVRITIMGGEPLLVSQYDTIQYLINSAIVNGYSIDVVTNGVDLDKFIPILTNSFVDHIQVTLDGIKEIHDKRRIFHDGSGSFEKIIDNVRLALKNHIKVYIRVNLDAENIDTLPLLAQLLNSLDNKEFLMPYIYLLQDGGCSGDSNVIRELSGIDQLYELEKKYPEVGIFAKRYHPIHLINSVFNNENFSPCLRHCGASSNQYILDCNGLIYKCWHGIGNINYACGKYFPETEWNTSINEWKNRCTLTIEICHNCKYRYICGTGCPAAKHSGTDCFDIKKESCADYEKLIDKLIRIHLDK